ncbi:hypothetical protein ACN28S_54110 [Cystobacter fuscus]
MRFRTGTDRPRPAVTASSIPEGAQDVYPLELYFDHEARRPGIYQRKQLSLRFSVPMRTTNAQVKLENHTDPSIAPRVITGQWRDEGRELLLTLPAPEDGGPGVPPWRRSPATPWTCPPCAVPRWATGSTPRRSSGTAGWISRPRSGMESWNTPAPTRSRTTRRRSRPRRARPPVRLRTPHRHGPLALPRHAARRAAARLHLTRLEA